MKASTVAIANFKGGAGKTTLAHHLAAAAAEAGQRVLAVDTDPQGDLYRRLAGHLHRDVDRPPLTWATGCICFYSPGGWEASAEPYDLNVVDTAPVNDVPKGPSPDVVVIPIDSIDAGLNANDTTANALDAGAKLVVLVSNGIAEGGPRHRKHFRDLGDDLPARVVLCEIELPRAASIKRTGVTCKPAWRDAYKDDGARKIHKVCNWVLAKARVLT